MKPIAIACVLAGALWAQQFKFNLDHLAGKASDSVDLSLNSNMLQLAAKFLDSKDPDEAKVKAMVVGLEGIFIKNYEFDKEGQYSKADVDQIRNQLKAPEWQRIVGMHSSSDGETIDVWVRSDNSKMSGVAIIATEPKSLLVANIVGSISLDSLADLGGHFGLPKLTSPPTPKKK